MMANQPEKSPDAGLWKYGQKACRYVANTTLRLFRVIARNRAVLMAVIKVAIAAVKLIAAIIDFFRHF